ncbi:hypothetical protein IL306_012638 [Fusarium sp. DS 682]|nr:hypothetical protein IL306_012638 [Fusarium sp. DS 682]
MIMALIRALIRRRLGADIIHCTAAKNYELDYLAIRLVRTQCEMFDNDEKQSDANYKDPPQETKRSIGQKHGEQPAKLCRQKWLRLRESKSHSKGQSLAEDQAPEKAFVWKVETAEVTESGTYSFPYPRPRESNDPPDMDNTEAQRVILVRKRLGDLCKWTSSASKPALALARSIESFLDEFLPNGLPATKKAAGVGIRSVVGHPPQNATTGGAKSPLPDISAYSEGDERIEWEIPFSCSDKGQAEPTKASDLLLQYSNADPATLTAQHLFTSFMWTIGECIPRQALHQGTLNIGENVKVQSSSMFDLHSNVGKLSGRKLNNVNLTRFVTYAEKQGLGTSDEILLCMIPTFSFYDRLPNDAVLGCDQPEIKLPGSSRSRDQTCARYSYFLDWIHSKEGASPGEYISMAGVARTVEFIYLLALDLANREARAPSETKPLSRPDGDESISDTDLERRGSSAASSDGDFEADNTSNHSIDRPRKRDISKELTALVGLLSGPFSDTLKKLIPFYELQGRKKTIAGYFNICLGNRDDTTWSDQVPSQDFMDQIGFTDLHREINNAGDEGFALESILVKNGMARDIFGWTPFHYAAARAGLQFSDSSKDVNDPSRATTGTLETLKKFLETNPPTGWWLDNFNRSPVRIAAFSGNNGLLKDLLATLPRRDVESAMAIGGRDGMKPLHLAAGRRQGACVTTLLEDIRFGTEIELDVWKQSPIHMALINHSYDCARQLSRSKNFDFSPETRDGFGRPLFFYLRGESPKKKKSLGAEILLKHWKKFEAQDGDNQSVLHLAMSFLDVGQLFDLLNELKGRQATQPNVDLINRYGETPLHLAVRGKKSKLVRCLMYFGASPSAKNHNQLSPMMLACDIGDLSLVHGMCQGQKYLGSEIDGQGRTALHHAIWNTKWSVHDCAQAVKMLAGVMVNVDALDQDHRSPLHYAARTCNGYVFSILRESKANIELIDYARRNVLHHAVLSDERNPNHSRKDLIDSICEQMPKGAIDSKDENGDTPLHLAIRPENDDTILCILSKDANPQIENDWGMTPFMTACRYGCCHKFIKYTVEQSNMLESNVDKNQPIMEDGCSNNAYRDKTEVKSTESGVNPHFKDFDINKVDSTFNRSALAWACSRGSVEVVKILLQAKAVSLSIQATENRGPTPLHLALNRDSQDIVQTLVADPRVISSLGVADNSGLTPIEFAVRESNESCLRQLLEHGNVGPERFSISQLEEIMDKHGETKSQTMALHEWMIRAKAGNDISFPFHKLARAGKRKEVEDLLRSDKNAFELDEDKWTPADVAQWYGHVDIMNCLRVKESKGGFIRPLYRWPSTFVDVYKNSTLKTSTLTTTTCSSLNSSPRLKLGQKQKFIMELC